MNNIDTINEQLRQHGLCEIAIVSPKDCLAQKKNARYFDAEMFQQLVANVKRDGRLESTPLVYRDGDKFRIISGHHRVDAAKEAGLEKILVLVTSPENRDEIVSKQLAHNAITGKDDAVVLSELFQSIEDLELKLATGLQDIAGRISLDSLNFKLSPTKEMTFLFLPDDEKMTDEAMEAIAEQLALKSNSTVYLASLAYYERFAQALRKVKKIENIKSNGAAFNRLIEIVKEVL
jgi:ParB-like chromosome segregation protein Spo0J